MIEILVITICAYLLGSIPSGYLLTKIILKKDIRNIGSGNIGATNVLRTGNKYIGYTTLFFDIIKAVLPITIINIYYKEYLFLAAFCIFIGHVFPVWLKFRGGKGIATYIGILFCINYFLGFLFVGTWFIFFLIFKYSSLSSLVASFLLPIYYYLLVDKNNFYFFIIMFILIFYTHRGNIKRLINNTETKSKIY